MSNTTTESDAIEIHESVSEIVVDESKSAPEDRESAGPFDVSEVPTMRPYIDFGGIKVAPREGLQLRLEVEEKTKRIVAITLEYAQSILQVQAFSAPKTSGLWHRVRADITEQITKQGGSVTVEENVLGAELVTVNASSGESSDNTRVVRFIAVDGPRWMLRGVLMGLAATDAVAREKIYEVFRDMVVVRGEQPMPPSELLTLKVPAGVAAGNTGSAGEAQGTASK